MSAVQFEVASEILANLRSAHQTLATAESLTGGLLSGALTDVPGSSDVFLGGIIAYSPAMKSALLHVDPNLIDAHGVVSAEVAIAMASGAIGVLGSDWAISTTGVAGPGPSDGVAAGTVWIAIAGPGMAPQAEAFHLEGNRQEVRVRTIARAFDSFTRILRG
jgi:nicotinamide-nucleotide amidase